METPIKKEIVDGLVAELGIEDFAKATIREVKQVAAKSEKASGVEFIKMEMGIRCSDQSPSGWYRPFLSRYSGSACAERGCLSVCEGVHRCGYQT